MEIRSRRPADVCHNPGYPGLLARVAASVDRAHPGLPEENHLTSLACTRSGVGAPLVLLHGLGSSRQAWNPVIPALAARFDVIAVDLPGFGDSNPVPAQTKPTPAALAAAVAGLLDDLGVTAPHLAGNSLGGWVALELAATRPAASLTLLSPAGLWREDAPGYPQASLRATRWLTRHADRLLSRLVAYRPGRAIVLGQTHGQPMRLTAEYAQAAIHAMGACPGFDATFTATAPRRYLATTPISAPVTVAFGSRDRLLLRHQSRYLGQLPPGTHLEALPGCGHIPMADDPGAVTALITRSARRAAASNDAASGNAATDDARTALRPLSYRQASGRRPRLRPERSALGHHAGQAGGGADGPTSRSPISSPRAGP